MNGSMLDVQNVENDGRRSYRFQPVEKVAEHGKLDIKAQGEREIERGIWCRR